MNKYRAVPTTVAGRTFHSTKEARRSIELAALRDIGEIANLRFQVRYPLVVNSEPIAIYVADFVYTRDGHEVIEDTKSPVTRTLPAYRLKKKLMHALYGVTILET